MLLPTTCFCTRPVSTVTRLNTFSRRNRTLQPVGEMHFASLSRSTQTCVTAGSFLCQKNRNRTLPTVVHYHGALVCLRPICFAPCMHLTVQSGAKQTPPQPCLRSSTTTTTEEMPQLGFEMVLRRWNNADAEYIVLPLGVLSHHAGVLAVISRSVGCPLEPSLTPSPCHPPLHHGTLGVPEVVL